MSEIDFKALQDFFAADEIEWRLQQAGEKNGKVWAICVPYVTNRAIMQRLDDTVGPGNWRNEFKPGPGGGVLCGISVKIDGEWVTKWDGAENTDIEGVKGGLSGAMKRAAVQWGVGRYLYALEESFARVSENGKLRGKTKQGTDFRWDPPALPKWAIPSAKSADRVDATPSEESRNDAIPLRSRAEGAHEAMLDYVRKVGATVADDTEIRVQRKVRNLKDFVRENWAVIKENPEIARTVVAAIEKATGTEFDMEKAA